MFGKKCLLSVGKAAKVDKVVTGSIKKNAVKILNVESGEYDKVAVEEFVNLDMKFKLCFVVNKVLGIENNQEQCNLSCYLFKK